MWIDWSQTPRRPEQRTPPLYEEETFILSFTVTHKRLRIEELKIWFRCEDLVPMLLNCHTTREFGACIQMLFV